MKLRIQERIVNFAALFVIGTVFIFTIIRLFYGVELSDEAYTVAETYMVSKGALPFVNNWSQMPGYTLLLAPFVKIYTAVVGGTEGIFLFFRFLSLFVNISTAAAVSYLLKDHIKNRMLLILFSMIYVGATGWDYVDGFRGDKLAIDLLAVGVLLIVKLFYEDYENHKLPFIAGILLALSVLSYPTFAIAFAFFVIEIIFLCYRRKNGYKVLLWFLSGAAVAAIIVVGYLAVNSSITDIFHGIGYLLKDVAYFQLENAGAAKLPAYIKDMVRQLIFLIVIAVGCFICVLIINFVLFRKSFYRIENGYYSIRRISVRRMALISLISGICLYQICQIWRVKTGDNYSISLYAMTIETLAVPLVWLFIESKRRICKYLMGLIWFPAYIWVVVTGIGTYSSIIKRHILLKNAAFLLGIFVYFAVCDNFNIGFEKDENNRPRGKLLEGIYHLSVKLIPVVLMMVITFTYLFNSYTYVYRDESVWKLNTVVSSGPYKGLHTTQIRAAGLIAVNKIIDEYIDKDDYVLAMDNDPFIYLMSDGKICTPCTWDQALYSYHFDQPDLYYDYFHVTGTEPTKIIYFNYGRDEIMSIDVKYKFNDYVNTNYHLIYEERNIFEWNYCGNDITCEILIYERK